MFYLRGRAMDDVPFQATVHAARQRLVNGESPVLDAALRRDIAAQADRTDVQANVLRQVATVASWRNFG